MSTEKRSSMKSFFSGLARLFRLGSNSKSRRSSSGRAASADELGPAPGLEGGGVELHGATMVMSRVPVFTAWFVVKKGGVTGQIFELKKDLVTIGQDEESDLQIDHRSISSPHVLIRVSQGRYTLFDMGSTGGSWVNGNASMGAFLKDGSRITIGTNELFFTQFDTDEKVSSGRGVILVRSGPSLGQSSPIEKDDLVIGRQPGERGAQLIDTSVSQQHALIRPTPHGCLIYDLGSANGTAVDDVALSGTLLQNGDLVKLGQIELQFVQEDSP